MRPPANEGLARRILRRVPQVASVLPLVFVGGLLVVHALRLPVNHDEYQYLAAGYLWPTSRPYADFFYSQTPYFPVLLSLWLDLAEGIPPFLAGRLFTCLCSLTFAGVLWIALVKVTRSSWIAGLILFGVTASPILDLPSQTMRNDMLPLALLTGATLVLLIAVRSRPRSRARLALCVGALTGAAVGVKHSYAFAPLALLISCLFVPGPGSAADRFRTLLIPLSVGAIAASLPVLYFASADWSNFLFDTVQFHRTSNEAHYARLGAVDALLLKVRLWTLFQLLTGGPTLVLLFITSWLVPLGLFRERSFWTDARAEEVAALAIALVGFGVAVPFLLLAKPLHAQYIAPLVLFSGLGCAATLGLLRSAGFWDLPGPRGRKARIVAIGLLGIGVAAPAVFNPYGKGIAYAVRRFPSGDRVWTLQHTQPVAEQLRKALGGSDPSIRIATLMSIYPIDAGFGIYEELAGAPFFFRVNSIYPPDELVRRRGLEPESVYEWLERAEVQAILVGYWDEIEKEFVRYARDHGFSSVEIDLRGGGRQHNKTDRGTLWVSPAIGTAELRRDRGSSDSHRMSARSQPRRYGGVRVRAPGRE